MLPQAEGAHIAGDRVSPAMFTSYAVGVWLVAATAVAATSQKE